MRSRNHSAKTNDARDRDVGDDHVHVLYRDHNTTDNENAGSAPFGSSSSVVRSLSIEAGYHDSDLERDNVHDNDDDYSDDDDDNDGDNDSNDSVNGNYAQNNFDPRNNNNSTTSSTPSNKYYQHRPPIYTPTLFQTHPHLAVLPVLLLEFLALALTRAVLPSLLLKRFQGRSYIIMGGAECLRGMLAFFACPLFGKVSDVWGRRPCLLVTVMGTLAPVCSLAFWRVEGYNDEGVKYDANNLDYLGEIGGGNVLDGVDAGEASEGSWYTNFGSGSSGGFHTTNHPWSSFHRIDVFVALFAFSGMFSSTFTLTFAYISDVVKDRDGRVAAYGLALATFGLSFTIGPLLGGYLANVDDEGRGQGGRNWMKMFHLENDNDNPSHIGGEEDDNHHSLEEHSHFGSNSDIHPLGQHRVFMTSLILAILDLFYIHFILPESLNDKKDELEGASPGHDYTDAHNYDSDEDTESNNNNPNQKSSSTSLAANASESNVPLPAGIGVSRRASSSWWNPFDSIRYLTRDPLLSTIGRVTFLYYTALHAVVSTLILYAARQFHLGPHRLGELMAVLGLSTMISEAVLVRIAIPALGEKRSMRLGLASFALQCVLLAVADSPWQLYLLCVMAIPGNMVYPSVSSLVSTSVSPEMVGRALGAVNGVKSLTEGVGPLLFGTLLTMSEKDAFPGWPYFIAAIMAALAYQVGKDLPGDDDENYACNFYMANKHGIGGGKKTMRVKYSLRLREEHEGLIEGMASQHDDER